MTELEYAKIIAKNIRRLTLEHGKTQADLAKDLKISKATISSWANGTRTPKMVSIDLLCHYFNCRREDIMEEKTSDPNYYTDPEVQKIAQSIYDNSDLRALFDAASDASADDLKKAAAIIRTLKGDL